MDSPRALRIQWTEANYAVMEAIADAAVAPYRGLLHPGLLREIEWLIADGLMMLEERHALLAAGWDLLLVEKPLPPELDSAELEPSIRCTTPLLVRSMT